jgi:hypothetical protein
MRELGMSWSLLLRFTIARLSVQGTSFAEGGPINQCRLYPLQQSRHSSLQDFSLYARIAARGLPPITMTVGRLHIGDEE